jgi:uncharacterized protein GlcG (DUF336 family)
MSRSTVMRSQRPTHALTGVERLEERCLLDAAGDAFVAKAFQDLLSRPVDPSGAAYFGSLLNQGTSRTQIVVAIEGSTEFLTDFVDAAFQQFLNRQPNAAEQANAEQILSSTGSPEVLYAFLTTSDEYYQTRGSNRNDDYVNALFEDLLQRGVEPDALNYFEQLLNAGAARSVVFHDIFDSVEGRQIEVNNLFQFLLGRPADNAAISEFVPALEQGATLNQVTAAIMASSEYAAGGTDPSDPPADNAVLSADQVNQLLARASAATPSNDGIIVIVDRGGNILGVSVENGVSKAITSNPATLTFAIDGALAEARTGAFFANNHAPLTSRTVQFISQSTITQRMVDSSPDGTDPNSAAFGPGIVAPIGIGGHFPPNIADTPQVDLFGIEFTNRDTTVNPGPDGLYGTADDIPLQERFNVNPAYIPASIPLDERLNPPNSYGFISGIYPNAQPRGIGTLPGGLPITLANGTVLGGIGVFYPGATGYASAENSSLSANFNPALPDRSLEAEYAAFAAVGGDPGLGLSVGTLGGIPPVPGVAFPLTDTARLDLVGVTLNIIGPVGTNGPVALAQYGAALGPGTNTGVLQTLGPAVGATTIGGVPVPDGWLVLPHDGVGITAAQVTQMVQQGVLQADNTRAAIRLPLGSTASMTFAVTDRTGEVLGLYRMPDSTIFSIDVAVAKARNVAYYNDATQLQPADKLQGVTPGYAFTNRTYRYLTQAFYPEGVGPAPGVWSALNDLAVNRINGLNVGPALPPSFYSSIEDYIAFHPNANFHDPNNFANQNGVVLFPGSSGVYQQINGLTYLVGGLGVSGDGVDQDDVVTTTAITGFAAPLVVQIDNVIFRGVRLPYNKFDRNPTGL